MQGKAIKSEVLDKEGEKENSILYFLKNNKVIDFINSKIHWINYHFFRRIKTIIKWMPILWKDGDFDSSYLFIIMRHKIKFMRDYISKRNFYVGAERDCEIMDLAIRLIDKVQNDWYQTEYFEYHESKFDFEEIEEKSSDGQKLYRLNDEILEDNFDSFFDKNRLTIKKLSENPLYSERIKELDLEKSEDKKTLALFISLEKHQKAKRLLFKIMNMHIENWWD